MSAITHADLDAMRQELMASMRSAAGAPIVKPTRGARKVERVTGPPPVIETVEAGGRSWHVATGWTAKDGSVGHYQCAHVRPLLTTAKGKEYVAKALTLADMDALSVPGALDVIREAIERVEAQR